MQSISRQALSQPGTGEGMSVAINSKFIRVRKYTNEQMHAWYHSWCATSSSYQNMYSNVELTRPCLSKLRPEPAAGRTLEAGPDPAVGIIGTMLHSAAFESAPHDQQPDDRWRGQDGSLDQLQGGQPELVKPGGVTSQLGGMSLKTTAQRELGI